jgi:8-oxo-dGTP diphosphatase
MPEVKVGVAVFVIKDSQFLMGKRKGSHGAGTWHVPGGGLEYGESFAAAAEREVFEETGMLIKNVAVLKITNDFFEQEDKHYITIWLSADWVANYPAIKEPEKCSAIGWFDGDTKPEPLLQPCWNNYLKED